MSTDAATKRTHAHRLTSVIVSYAWFSPHTAKIIRLCGIFSVCGSLWFPGLELAPAVARAALILAMALV